MPAKTQENPQILDTDMHRSPSEERQKDYQARSSNSETSLNKLMGVMLQC